jgi:hypothetical protein
MTFVDVTAEFPAMPFVDSRVESPLLTETDIPITTEADASIATDRACADGFSGLGIPGTPGSPSVPGTFTLDDEFAVLIVTDTHIFFATDTGSEMSATGIQYSNLGV